MYYEGSRPALSVSVLYQKDEEVMTSLLRKARAELAETLKASLKEFLKGKRKQIPAHLKSVSLQKQYMHCDLAMLMFTLRLAMKKGLIRDEGYDKEVQPPCPMILIIDK